VELVQHLMQIKVQTDLIQFLALLHLLVAVVVGQLLTQQELMVDLVVVAEVEQQAVAQEQLTKDLTVVMVKDHHRHHPEVVAVVEL
jgi:hypothetical protein